MGGCPARGRLPRRRLRGRDRGDGGGYRLDRGGEAGDRALADELGLRKAEISGVNLGEELSRLVLYQQAYSVSARLVSITNELFDDLLAIAG